MHEQEKRHTPLSIAVHAICGFLLSALIAYGISWHLLHGS
ncbi:MAG: hypothetical protein JWL84_4965 [Rhodospirillales bacterium]|jgi:hypothetical protein|nr:hypothetical protein [Rhodospirillales bacterium]